ncbi:hypothetical protein GUR46_03935 [Stenotrophomonas maltophilia]|uniref:hypothetical protein n=1 Tax=Stenotrophomonas maltophilia TaxID=40324 RepID=UPI001F261263|nr:hypothetical protein [Stenotrophomonas maltophilia]MCF3528036.1 hypothetical protein [Stenotrophomonas maltophilia]MCF3531920.1 hypothetical protein [Stenotrophomonas maltophilia]
MQFIVYHLERETATCVRWELPPALGQALVAGGLKAHPGPRRLSILTHRAAALSKVHQLRQPPNPADSTEFLRLLADARRAAHKRGARLIWNTA